MTSTPARPPRLRAALAAVLVPDKTPGLRLMHDWLDFYVAVSPKALGLTIPPSLLLRADQVIE